MESIERKIKIALLYFLQPRIIIFLITLFNFVWFFSQSRIVVEFDSNSLTFCYICPWYWDWSFTNLPTLSLVAATFMSFARWKGYLLACIIGFYQIVDGITWVSNASGFLSGIQQRIQLFQESEVAFNVSDLLDIQYLLALVIFTTTVICLAKSIFDAKQTRKISYP